MTHEQREECDVTKKQKKKTSVRKRRIGAIYALRSNTPKTRRSEPGCGVQDVESSYLSGFVKLLLQPRYRHGCYTVVLAEGGGRGRRVIWCRRRAKERGNLGCLIVCGGDLAAVANSRLRRSSPEGSPARGEGGRLKPGSGYWMSGSHV